MNFNAIFKFQKRDWIYNSDIFNKYIIKIFNKYFEVSILAKLKVSQLLFIA